MKLISKIGNAFKYKNLNKFIRFFNSNKKYSGQVAIGNSTLVGDISRPKRVLISHNGCVQGNIEAYYLEVFGEVRGDIDVVKLLIHSSGKLYCRHAQYSEKTIYDGGLLSIANNTEKMEHEKEHKEKSSIVEKPKQLPSIDEKKEIVVPKNDKGTKKTIFYRSM